VVRRTDIKVGQIADEFKHLGMLADAIVGAHSHTSFAEVHSVLAYFYDHQALIRNEWQKARAFVAEIRVRYPSRLNQ